MTRARTLYSFTDLARADLVLDAEYAGGTVGTVADDPLNRLLPVGNQGGFRYRKPKGEDVRLVVLYTSGENPDWPDVLDEKTGLFTYYGDNRSPGGLLHETPRSGNVILRDSFAAAHADADARRRVPPFLLFARAKATGRSVLFRGLLAPGADTLGADDDLQAIWRSTDGRRFQNYRAKFTVLNTPVVTRAWIEQILDGNPLGSECPEAWIEWVRGRAYDTLTAPATKVVRSRSEQMPDDAAGRMILSTIHQHFAGRWHDFEACAVELWRMLSPNTGATTVTRASRDYGRDAVGIYQLGPAADRVSLDFVLEAKCYAPDRSVGVEDTSRLISRIRHRMFGVLVTTASVHSQAYSEVREDQHPIVIICGRDIVDILRSKGYITPEAVAAWLNSAFPPQAETSPTPTTGTDMVWFPNK
ncbi:restriction endonuclease [Actinoplanes sp. Pm04-4]|uniref:Restriction endonuclease n=1 Tax=Paractinoplanes pyxinae TaxID=2997416 RepID=A0ABT4B1Z1_9ACTN|nr:restriction endonuclease [Actinoplanes pyxinae]MCY1140523.1 restriction endonuclease [Actinoplanes pyxinae]